MNVRYYFIDSKLYSTIIKFIILGVFCIISCSFALPFLVMMYLTYNILDFYKFYKNNYKTKNFEVVDLVKQILVLLVSLFVLIKYFKLSYKFELDIIGFLYQSIIGLFAGFIKYFRKIGKYGLNKISKITYFIINVLLLFLAIAGVYLILGLGEEIENSSVTEISEKLTRAEQYFENCQKLSIHILRYWTKKIGIRF